MIKKKFKQGEFGLKDAKGKLMMDLVIPEVIIAIAEVLTFGAKKYKPDSWQAVKDGNNVHYASLMRHLMAWRKGEKYDKESGLSHLKHMMCNAMFLLYHEEKNGNKR